MKRLWTAEELTEQWTLHPDELVLLGNKTGHTRLGSAVLLKFFAREGRFPYAKPDVAGAVVAHIARQVGVPSERYLEYDWEDRSIEYHRAQIRALYGFRVATVADAEELVRWLTEHVLPVDQGAEHLRAAVYGRCRVLRIEPPAEGRLDRLIASAVRAHEDRFCRGVLDRLPAETLERMDALLGTGDQGARQPGGGTPVPARAQGRSRPHRPR